MRLTFWQFMGIVVVAALIWFLIHIWGEEQDTWAWVDTMQGWFIKSEKELQEDEAPPPDAEGWIQ